MLLQRRRADDEYYMHRQCQHAVSAHNLRRHTPGRIVLDSVADVAPCRPRHYVQYRQWVAISLTCITTAGVDNLLQRTSTSDEVSQRRRQTYGMNCGLRAKRQYEQQPETS